MKHLWLPMTVTNKEFWGHKQSHVQYFVTVNGSHKFLLLWLSYVTVIDSHKFCVCDFHKWLLLAVTKLNLIKKNNSKFWKTKFFLPVMQSIFTEYIHYNPINIHKAFTLQFNKQYSQSIHTRIQSPNNIHVTHLHFYTNTLRAHLVVPQIVN